MLSNPSQPAGNANANVVRQLSLWLYQVLPNEHLRNAPNVRTRDASGDDSAEFYAPLALNLYYLLTPSTGNDLGDHVMGRSGGATAAVYVSANVVHHKLRPVLGKHERVLPAETCEDLADAAALIMAMAIDPDAASARSGSKAVTSGAELPLVLT